MPSAVKSEISASAFALDDVANKPRQGRSKASLGRMLEAARGLMLERGSEEFTLLEVSERGNVSIGSIYLRFESKDNLVRGVIAEAMEALARDEAEMLAGLTGRNAALADFVPAYVEAYAEILRRHAPLLRLTMKRASFDPLVFGPGKEMARSAQTASIEAMLACRSEFGGGDPAMKAQSAYHIVFASLAQQLSLGAIGDPAFTFDWSVMKRELGRMCLAYLRSD